MKSEGVLWEVCLFRSRLEEGLTDGFVCAQHRIPGYVGLPTRLGGVGIGGDIRVGALHAHGIQFHAERFGSYLRQCRMRSLS